MNNENKENLKPVGYLSPFKKFCMTIGELPASYLETMTYYEMLLWFTNYLGNTIIPTINNNAECIDELQNKYVEFTAAINEELETFETNITEQQNTFENNITEQQNTFETNITEQQTTFESTMTTLFNTLQTYVNNYFDNLDVQEEINNKLDDMVEDGTLQEIITHYIQSAVTWTFSNVATMKSSTNLINGSYAKTLGYYNINDGGDGIYLITNEELTEDGGSVIELDSGLFAKLLINDHVKTKQFGAKGDGTTDDTTYIQNLFNYVETNKQDGITIIVNGFHYVNYGLSLNGTSNNKLKNLCLIGLNGNRDYGKLDNLQYGFKFTTDFETTGFENNYGILFNYCLSPKIQYLKLISDENISNGEIPLNNISGIGVTNTDGIGIDTCLINSFYKGINIKNCGLSRLENNNVSLCNIGISLFESGDNNLTNNYVNTCGWNIRNLDGTLKERYTSLQSISRCFGIGIYLGASSNGTIHGGKVEWNLKGIWQDYSNCNIITSINFDRNSCYAIGLSGHYTFWNSTIISNNNFKSCGGIQVTGDSLTGHAISSMQGDNIVITSNNFISAGGSSLAVFKKDGVYYGSKAAPIHLLRQNRGVISNNVFNCDNTPITTEFSQVAFENNIFSSANPYISGNSVFYIHKLNRKEYLRNDSNFTFGNFDVNDIIKKYNNPTQGYRCTTAGTIQTIATKGTVMMTASDDYPNDGTIIRLDVNSYPAGLTTGSYINIDGVTGTKKIENIRYKTGDGWYLKLNTACDVAVINADITNASPVFTEYGV